MIVWVVLGVWLAGWLVSTVVLLLRMYRVRTVSRGAHVNIYLAMFVWWPVIAGMMAYEHFEGRHR